MNESAPIRFCPFCGMEVEKRDVAGEIRPVCPACGYIHFQDPKVAAGVLVESDGKVLLVRRINEPMQGKWTLPAGFVDGQENPRSTAARECLEETGLEVVVVDLMDVIYGREHPRGASIMFVYRGRIVGGALAAGDDAEAVGFFEAGDLPPLGFEATKQVLARWADERLDSNNSA
ncbi:MAG: NUDIX hydrolase [Anaerolineales bacterium]|nr:NUDIX hydrolase [Anaerolineales bacterium]